MTEKQRKIIYSAELGILLSQTQPFEIPNSLSKKKGNINSLGAYMQHKNARAGFAAICSYRTSAIYILLQHKHKRSKLD